METRIFGDKKIIIRKLTPSDVNQPEKFQKFVNSLIAEDAMILMNTKKTKKDELEWLKRRLKEVKQRKAVYLIAENNKEIVGTCNILLERERSNHIGGLGIAVKQGFRGIGLGKYLMENSIKMAKADLRPTPKIIELGVYEGNLPAIALYKKMGFKPVAKIPNSVQYKGKLIVKIIMQLEI
ncbi:MAG: GNAT family N-acetyltransferase [Candidatus Pacebacteria bacterium]|nr:GNAT family N-acetyltransferase [Candidatus Paceibacterota bacterium]